MTDPYPLNKPLPKGATWGLPSPEKMRLEVETGVFSPESLAIADSILTKATDLSERSAVDSYIEEDRWWEDGIDELQENAVAASQHALRNPADWIHDSVDAAEEEREYMERTNAELRQMAIDEEDAGKKPLRDPENDDWWAQQEYFGAPRGKSFIEKQTDDIMKRVTAAPLPSGAHFKQLSTAAKKATKSFRKLSKNMPKPRVGANLQYRPFLILSTLRDDLTK